MNKQYATENSSRNISQDTVFNVCSGVIHNYALMQNYNALLMCANYLALALLELHGVYIPSGVYLKVVVPLLIKENRHALMCNWLCVTN